MSSIGEFYCNEQILITGGTGFVGKLMISKLLLSCPEIKKIILLARPQENVDKETRLKNLFDDVIFEKLKRDYPSFREKIELVEGNCAQQNLGLSQINKFSITQRVTVVFHCAANVEFNQDLKTEVKNNVVGAIEIIKLAKYIRNLKALVYVSSAYANCHLPVIEEKFYKPGVHYKTLIKLTDGDFLNSNERRILGDVRSTYFYSKSAAEQVIIEEGKNLPVAIFRPSAIVSTWKEPIAGWTNKAFAPTSVIKYLALGYFSSIHCTDDIIIDMVPADFTVNALIATGWDVYNRFICHNLPEPRIYNYVSMMDNTLKFKTFLIKCFGIMQQKPSNQAVWYPVLSIHKSRLINRFCSLTRPWLLAAAVQLWDKICGKTKSKWSKSSEVYVTLMDLLNSMIKYPHIYLNENIRELWQDMNEEDRKIFLFDLKELNWDRFLKTYYDGILRFLLKEENRDEESALRRMIWLKTIHLALTTLLYLCGLLFLQMIFCRICNIF